VVTFCISRFPPESRTTLTLSDWVILINQMVSCEWLQRHRFRGSVYDSAKHGRSDSHELQFSLGYGELSQAADS
jgi:hypothetical protein